jgi:integrase
METRLAKDKPNPLKSDEKGFSLLNQEQTHILQVQRQQLLLLLQQMSFQKYLSVQLAQMKLLQDSTLTNLSTKELNPYGHLNLKDMAEEFVNSFDSAKTRSTYSEGFSQLYAQGFLRPDMTLFDFSQICGENLLDDVRKNYKMKTPWKNQYCIASESTKQLRAAMLLAFSSFLQRRTEGLIKKIASNKYGFNKTFRHRRQKTIASRLTVEQLKSFLVQLEATSRKGFLFAVLQIIGAKRLAEVLQLKVDEVDLKNSRVLFRNLKQRGYIKEPVFIYIPAKICMTLQAHIGQRKEGFLFLKCDTGQNNLPLTKSQITKLYEKTWSQVRDEGKPEVIIRPRMITHSLRAAGISLLYDQGIDSQLIKQITGHNSGDMIMYYNTSNYDNLGKNICVFDMICNSQDSH